MNKLVYILAVGLLSVMPVFICQAQDTPSDDGAVTLKLHHPDKVGQSIELTQTFRTLTTFTYSRNSVEFKKTAKQATANSDLIVRCLEVNEQGRSIKSRVFVKNLIGRGLVIPDKSVIKCKGSTIIVTQSPGQAFNRMDGKPLTSADLAYLRLLFPKIDDTDPDEDALVGVDHPVKVGETWDPDGPQLGTLMSGRMGYPVDVSSLQDEVSLARRTKAAGFDAAVVTFNVHADSVAPPESANVSDPSGSLVFEGSYTVPIDPEKPLLGATYHGVLDLNGITGDDQAADADFKAHIEADLNMTVTQVLP